MPAPPDAAEAPPTTGPDGADEAAVRPGERAGPASAAADPPAAPRADGSPDDPTRDATLPRTAVGEEAGTVSDPAGCSAAPGADDPATNEADTAAADPAATAAQRSGAGGTDAAPAVTDSAEACSHAGEAGAVIGDPPAAGFPPDAGAAAPDAPPTDPALFAHALRVAEALVFASDRPVTPARLQGALPPGCDARAVLTALSAACAGRPVQLVEVAGGFAFRTAPELAPAITRVVEAPRRLPRAAMETLAIVAYHQPVTRAEIEEIRGASLSQSTLELLLDAALIAPRGRKEVPGRPSLWGTTPRFLEQFGLKALSDLPRREELVNEPPALPLPPPAPTSAGA